MLLADQAYLLSVLAGGSRVPSVVASQSACYCFPWDVMWSVRVQALAAASGITNPNTLANGAVQFMASGYPHDAVQAYLLSVLAGGSTDPATIGAAAIQFSGLTPQAMQQILTMLVVAWSAIPVTPPIIPGLVILSDGAGGFCQLVVDITGNVGAQASAGPATAPAPVLADGFGGFWQIVTDSVCDRGTTSVAGPATVPIPTLVDSNAVVWSLVVDQTGNLGATS